MSESLKSSQHADFVLPGNQPLSEEYEAARTLFFLQSSHVQRFLEAQARSLAEAIIQKASQVRFTLPDRVRLPESSEETPVPLQARDQMAGGLVTSLTRTDLRTTLRQRLGELEGSGDGTVLIAAQLIRYAVAWHMIHERLPAGRAVTYVAVEGEEIPTLPMPEAGEASSALTSESDAIAEEGESEEREELVVPYVPAARRFYLPQWVAFDDEGRLLIASTQEAEGFLNSMQQFTGILHAAIGLAPYMVVDEEYQRKRYGILGQLINQGRALAIYKTTEIIQTIQRRAAAGDLNRGLNLSLPYFDDQDLQMRLRDFQVIPAGRIMFVPGFVVRGAREEQVKVAQDTRLSVSTRKHLMKELAMLETTFLENSEI